MAQQSRYDVPVTNVGTAQQAVDNPMSLGGLYTQLEDFRSGALMKQWNLEDEKIQLDLLKGSPIQNAFDSYMNLAAVAGAAGEELASVTFQQKAYSLLQAEQSKGGGGGGRGRGGSGGSGVGVSSAEQEASDLKNDNANMLTDIADTWNDVALGRTEPVAALEAIQQRIAEQQQKWADLQVKYADGLFGGSGGRAKTGFGDLKKEIDANLSLGLSKQADSTKDISGALDSIFGADATKTGTPAPSGIELMSSYLQSLKNGQGVLYYDEDKPDSVTGMDNRSAGARLRVAASENMLLDKLYAPLQYRNADGSVTTLYVPPDKDSVNSYVSALQGEDPSLARLRYRVPVYDRNGTLIQYNSYEVNPEDANAGWLPVTEAGARIPGAMGQPQPTIGSPDFGVSDPTSPFYGLSLQSMQQSSPEKLTIPPRNAFPFVPAPGTTPRTTQQPQGISDSARSILGLPSVGQREVLAGPLGRDIKQGLANLVAPVVPQAQQTLEQAKAGLANTVQSVRSKATKPNVVNTVKNVAQKFVPPQVIYSPNQLSQQVEQQIRKRYPKAGSAIETIRNAARSALSGGLKAFRRLFR